METCQALGLQPPTPPWTAIGERVLQSGGLSVLVTVGGPCHSTHVLTAVNTHRRLTNCPHTPRAGPVFTALEVGAELVRPLACMSYV